ncbi:hypothetical protein [Methanoculleus caldifontis]|uniref:hypothetical protein n=1 Tax=Methanoculleus caldifontis TaxID=2651577 RepID=UPI003744662C
MTVADPGPDVPDEKRASIFYRSERGEEEERGEGPGLYITKTPVMRHAEEIGAGEWGPGHPGEDATSRLTLQKSDHADGRTQDPGGLTG